MVSHLFPGITRPLFKKDRADPDVFSLAPLKWPAIDRNEPRRLQVGIPGRITSESTEMSGWQQKALGKELPALEDNGPVVQFLHF
jgi:hypothetical protein